MTTPTFRYDCACRPDFLKLVARKLELDGIAAPGAFASGCYRRYSGDFNRLGKGEILVYDQR